MKILYLVNGITIYRIIAVPLLLYLVFNHNIELFKWLLALSFFTDAIDGYLARKFNATSLLGARLDTIGDDLTIGVAIVAMFVFHIDFIRQNVFIIIVMLALYFIQNLYAFIRYHKQSAFHTYLAKISAVLQAVFIIFAFFLEPNSLLFYVASILTTIELIEEIILIYTLKNWKANVKGLYWVNRGKNPVR